MALSVDENESNRYRLNKFRVNQRYTERDLCIERYVELDAVSKITNLYVHM